MVDWKKDIKLSDLVRRKKSDDAPTEEKAPKKSRFARKPKAEKPPKESKPPKAARQVNVPRRGKKLVGLKVGASQLAAARIVNNGQPELLQVAREELEPGIVVAGELREPDALADALKRFFRAHKLPRTGVRLGIASNRIGVRIFEISDIDDEKQLHNAIRFRAQEALPIPLDEAVIDYHVLGESVDEEGVRSRRVLLVVVYRDLVDRYVAACRKAGVKLVGIDLEAFAALRALGGGNGAQGNAAVVVASIGHDRTTLAVSSGSVCEFTRIIEWGGQNLNVAIARAMDVAPSEAEPVKRSLSLLEPAETWASLSAEQAVKVREALQRELEAFSRELISSLQFYQGQPGSLGIGEIVLTGGSTHLPGLDVELGNLIGVRVRVGDPLARVKRGKRITGEEQLGSLAVAIGLGIEEDEVRAVNLLPRDDPRGGRARKNDPVMVGGVCAVVAATAIIAAFFLVSSTGVADKQKRLDAAQAELDATPVPPPAPEGNSALEQDKSQRIAALSAVLSKRLAWDRVFRELSLVLPEDVWLSTLSAKAPDAAAAATPGAPSAGFTINGQTYSHDGVARLLSRLALVPHLSGVQLQHSARATSESGRSVVEFSIVASVKAPGAA